MSIVTAKTLVSPNDRIYQCDIFREIEIVESLVEHGKRIEIKRLQFPMVICLNQDCDLNSDYRARQITRKNSNCQLLHLIVAPVFNFNSFMNGGHWGDIFDVGERQKLSDTSTKKIMNNENPRYHYLCFDSDSGLPNMIIDFKHFFTVNTDCLYQNIDRRVRAIEVLYREKISQRFAYYISRIGLPD